MRERKKGAARVLVGQCGLIVLLQGGNDDVGVEVLGERPSKCAVRQHPQCKAIPSLTEGAALLNSHSV